MTAANENVTENGSENSLGPDEDYSAPWGLKLLVAGLGVAIVLMLGLIVWKVMAGDHKKGAVESDLVEADPLPEIKAAGSVLTGTTYLGDLQDLVIERPEGAELLSYAPNGAEIILRFRLADGADLLLSVNRATGKQTRLTIAK